MSVYTQEFSPDHWVEALRALSAAYVGWQVTIEVLNGELGDQPEANGLPLQGLSLETKGSEIGDILVEAGELGVAYMIHQACRAPRGVVLTLTGPSQRYCLRELQYLGMMSQGFPTTTVTGMEFVAVLTRAEEYRRTGKLPEVMSGRQEN